MALKLDRLNPKQRQAVLFDSGPLLILAGAGSGKTSTMAYRIAHLVSTRGLPASSVLGLSFTNKAAMELRDRVRQLVIRAKGPRAIKGLIVTTFHSLCVRILRAHAEELGYQRNFSIVDQNDQIDVLKQVLRNTNIDDRKFDPQVILFEIGQAKNRFLDQQQAEAFFLDSKRLSSDYAIAAASVYPRYQEQLRFLNSMDFDDLIFHTVGLLENHPEIRAHYDQRFKQILVDEYQDTNPAQFRILRLLTQESQNLCVVGDDDQSIYSWRGADPSHILEFSNHYPGAERIILDQNYRSTNRILDAANQVIDKNHGRYPKKLWSNKGVGEPIFETVLEDDHEEAEYVGEEILKRQKQLACSFGDFAILYRSNAQSRVFEEALRRKRIPYKIVGGLSFLERKEVKNILAYWRLISNSQDDASLRRVINWPARGIGRTSMEALHQTAKEKNQTLFETLSAGVGSSSKATKAIQSFEQMIQELGSKLRSLPANGEAVSQWAKASLEKIQAKKAIEDDSDDSAQTAKKWENVEELIHSIGQFRMDDQDQLETHSSDQLQMSPISTDQSNGEEFLRQFIHRLTLDALEDEKEDEKNKEEENTNRVTLLTLHGSKGLEFPIVFLVGMEDGILPHKRTIEYGTQAEMNEERRLCYVGITRAQRFLYITRTANRIRYGKAVKRIPSRFLGDIPEDLILLEDHSTDPDLSTQKAKEAQVKHEAKVKDFLSQIRASISENKKIR